MAFSWPTNAAGYSAAGQRSTTVKWGTGGLSNSAVVISADEAREVDKIYLEQGDGLKATRIMLNQGSNWDFTIQDDSAAFATPPAIGDQVTVIDLIGSGSNCAGATYKGVIVDNNYRAARRSEGHRVLRVEQLTLVDNTAAGSSPSF
jgi:hypothetical protein